MIWIVFAMLLYSVAIIFATAASRNTNTNIAAAIINAVSAAVPIAVSIPILSKKVFHDQRFGMLMAVATGVLIAFFVMSINKAYATNKVGVVAPAVFGGAIFISTILSYFIYKEKISLVQGFGLALLAAGFVIVIYARATGK